MVANGLLHQTGWWMSDGRSQRVELLSLPTRCRQLLAQDRETSRVLACSIFKSAFIRLYESPDCVCFRVCLLVIMLIKQLLLALSLHFVSFYLCLVLPSHSFPLSNLCHYVWVTSTPCQYPLQDWTWGQNNESKHPTSCKHPVSLR